MDVGKFKASRLRLMLWILVPPVLAVGAGLGTYTMRLRSEWELKRTRKLDDVLPRLVETRRQAEAVVAEFRGSDTESLRTEDELISFLQEAAQESGFPVDSIGVERRSAQGRPLLAASVKGAGTFNSIQRFMGDVSSAQHLLSESSLKLSKNTLAAEDDSYKADLLFELVLFNPSSLLDGGAK